VAALPDNLDLLTVSVEAGLGFDQALLKLVEKTQGPLTDEFKRVLQEMRIGKTRRDALREMSVRAGVEDLQTFVVAIIQADQLGVGIGKVLRIQSQQLRERRRLKAEERAQKAPVKMLIPMVVFIFPCLFIILLGPGVLQLIDNFAKMK
jgi:tight adherence protein C